MDHRKALGKIIAILEKDTAPEKTPHELLLRQEYGYDIGAAPCEEELNLVDEFDEDTIVSYLKALTDDRMRLIFITIILNSLGYRITMPMLAGIWSITPEAIYWKKRTMRRKLNAALSRGEI